MHSQCEVANIYITNMPIIHKSLFVGTSGAKKQERNDKSKVARAPPTEKVMKTRATKASFLKDPTLPSDDVTTHPF